MFGYVRTSDDELRVREYKAYRALYCGLCRALGKSVGRLSRLTLSYDFVFLAILRYKALGVLPDFGEISCGTSRRQAAVHDDVLDYCARAGAVLTWYKLDDDVRDRRGLKRLAARVLRSCASGMKKKARLPELEIKISDGLSRLSELESKMAGGDENVTPDVLAEVSGEMLSDVFSYGTEGDAARILGEAGLHTGRWIYFADAADDLADDKKSGQFNPFLGSELPESENVRCAMLMELKELRATVALLPDGGETLDALSDNITGYGMTAQTEEIVGSLGKAKKKRNGGGRLRIKKGGRL
ncbi:MAG: hypothetical protein IKX86_02970 [Clostridia bacterium]|nr:hypothetical protein [Clostridia bacterium]